MSCFHTRKFIVSNAVVALAISLLRRQHGRKLWWEQVRKSWKTGVKQKQRQRSKMQPLPMHSLVPRLGGGWERASGTQCLRMRLIATEFRGNCVHTCMYTGDFINLLRWLAVGVLFEWILYRDSLLQDTIKWSVWGVDRWLTWRDHIADVRVFWGSLRYDSWGMICQLILRHSSITLLFCLILTIAMFCGMSVLRKFSTRWTESKSTERDLSFQSNRGLQVKDWSRSH